MPTSGSFDFTVFRNDIIEDAYRLLGAKLEGSSLTNEQISKGDRFLNKMVKNWRKYINLWNIEFTPIPMSASDKVLGSDGFDYEAIRTKTSTLADQPITGANHLAFWKKLTTSGAPPWVVGTDYTAAHNIILANRFLGIKEARIKEGTRDTPLDILTRREYSDQGDKTTPGRPSLIYFQRRELPEIFIFPSPDSNTIANTIIELELYAMPADFDDAADEADYLQEWLSPLSYGLATDLATTEGIFGKQRDTLEKRTDKLIENALAVDHDFGDVQFKARLRA